METDQDAGQDLSRLFVQRLHTSGVARPFWVSARVSWAPEWLRVHRTTLLLGKVGQLEEAQSVADTLFSQEPLILDFWMEVALDEWGLVWMCVCFELSKLLSA